MTAYEMRLSDWSSDVCSSDLVRHRDVGRRGAGRHRQHPGRLLGRHGDRAGAAAFQPGAAHAIAERGDLRVLPAHCHSPAARVVRPRRGADLRKSMRTLVIMLAVAAAYLGAALLVDKIERASSRERVGLYV